MTLPPRWQKGALAAHIASSVGWFGAVLASLALAVVGLASTDGDRVRAVYLTLELLGWYVLIPLAAASLVTGLVQAVSTRWGLFRHYWVVVKLVMNVSATVVLLLYMRTLTSLAAAAKAAAPGDVAEVRDASPAVHAAVALVFLVVATTLSVYKPRGRIRLGRA